MKKILNLILAISLFAAAPVVMAEGALDKGNFSANIAYTTDYVYRGITLSDDGPAVSGGFDWGYSGFYLGTWASSISPVAGESVEIDWYGGYGGEISGISYSLDLLYYYYPGAASGADLDFFEFGGSLGYTFAAPLEPTLGFSVMHSEDGTGGTDSETYYKSNLDLSLPAEFGLSFTYGYQDFDEDKVGINGYNHWGVDISKSLSIFDFTIGYSDTDSNGESFEGDGTEKIVFTVGASF